MTDWNHASLEELPQLIWNALDAAVAEAAHPFRLASIGTHSPATSDIRTVVLRKVDDARRELIFYTDVRSPKVTELRHDRRVTWLFHDPNERIQLRASAVAQIHHGDEIAANAWEQTPVGSRVNYCTTNPPGTAIASWSDSLPADLRNTTPDFSNTAAGQENFAVVATTVERFDWLWLNPARHRRAAFAWNGTAFQGNWLTP